MDYQIPEPPAWIHIKGASRREYSFQAFNIEDPVDENMSGVYIFTITHLDDRIPPGRPSHLFVHFESIRDNYKEAFLKAKEKNANHFLVYSSGSEPDRRAIIKDIQESEDYQYQLREFPELVGAQ